MIVKMGKWRGWLCCKQSFLLSTKCIFLKINSGFRKKNKGKRDVLLSLYKDLESCQEYEDIQVMWAMVHSSSCTQNSRNTSMKKRASYWRFCFRPT
ncbi:U-box domain-containing protein [Melia azedarach]|uniref:U-box domain-containing protein n=1 Tax=Melia azedarach TaxID=155640 RepID=A0ACC1WZM8_MELAZ|nr:U-box domain-containing protein [Melia azedarach]